MGTEDPNTHILRISFIDLIFASLQMFRMATSNEMDAAETLGLMKGLTAVDQSHTLTR